MPSSNIVAGSGVVYTVRSSSAKCVPLPLYPWFYPTAGDDHQVVDPDRRGRKEERWPAGVDVEVAGDYRIAGEVAGDVNVQSVVPCCSDESAVNDERVSCPLPNRGGITEGVVPHVVGTHDSVLIAAGIAEVIHAVKVEKVIPIQVVIAIGNRQ